MAGEPAYLLLRPVAPVQPLSAFKTRMRILSPLPKSIWKLRVSPQSPCENPLFAEKTHELSDRVRRPQTKIEVLPAGAEAVVAHIGGKLGDFIVNELGDFIVNEGKHLIEVHDDLKRIKEELEYMQCFLEDADSKQITDARVRKLVAEIRDISYEVEDAVDTFIYSRQRRREFTENVKRTIFKPITDRKVAKQIERIKQKISDISRRRDTYGIKDINEERQEARLQERRRLLAVFEDPEVDGLQEEIETVREKLIYEEPTRCVVSIVGMGGLGKTTLANKVYHAVKDDFDCHAFVCLSKQYEIREVLMCIIKCVMGTSLEEQAKLKVEDLGKKLGDHLRERRYLVVIDDVWSIEAWDILKHVLPDGKEKSRVMLTTRIREVALHAGPSSHLHEKRFLDDNEGWKLFLKTVFSGENPRTTCPSNLLGIGGKILAKCRGVPLAILVLGRVLSTKPETFDAWSKVLQSVNRHLTENPEKCMGILALSYWDLPPHLKPCFLYLGLFPEDYEIDSEKLIRLWIAEGFIQQRDDEPMEDVAEDYLEELVDRSMVQALRKRFDGPVVKCYIHDLLRDLSLSKATQNNFFTTHNVEGACSFSSTSVRRLALHRSINGYRLTVTLRSILSFWNSRISHSDFSQAKSLRVVCQGYHGFTRRGPDGFFHRGPILTTEVREFILLTYLELDAGEGLPPSIGDLSSLQTLVLNQTSDSLPIGISNLERLRHLDARYCMAGNLQVNNLTNLQTLRLGVGNWIKDGFGNLTNLRRLSIVGSFSLNDEEPSNSIDKLRNLRVLELEGFIHLPQLKPFTYHFHLYEMSLFGRMQKLPELPPNLAQLVLSGSNLKQDAICILEKLPHLKILQFFPNSFDSKKMICSSGGFPQLEVLMMHRIPLEEWIIEKEAMPSLKCVILSEMPNLKTLPQQVRDLLKRDVGVYMTQGENLTFPEPRWGTLMDEELIFQYHR